MAACSIIIPVRDQAPVTANCLKTLLAPPEHLKDAEIIVVDDGSTPPMERVPGPPGDQVRLVAHEINRGFAAACNTGAEAASGEYLVFLNNDTVPREGWLDALVRYAEERPRAAAVGSKLLFPDETVQHAGVVIGQDLFP